jgi:prepilin-type N-terminal cleavage/methylation domain-containing protein
LSKARAGRRGFTVIELLTAVVVLGTVARMAYPDLHAMMLRAQAADVAAAVETARAAAERFHRERLRWPDDGYAGQVPPQLEGYLPEGFRFEGAGFRLDWELWPLPDGLPGEPSTRGLAAISVVTSDAALGRAVADLLPPGTAHWALDDTYTFVVARIP